LKLREESCPMSWLKRAQVDFIIRCLIKT
jgi:hypothetical protein